jgi:hypothetical protein
MTFRHLSPHRPGSDRKASLESIGSSLKHTDCPLDSKWLIILSELSDPIGTGDSESPPRRLTLVFEDQSFVVGSVAECVPRGINKGSLPSMYPWVSDRFSSLPSYVHCFWKPSRDSWFSRKFCERGMGLGVLRKTLNVYDPDHICTMDWPSTVKY